MRPPPRVAAFRPLRGVVPPPPRVVTLPPLQPRPPPVRLLVLLSCPLHPVRTPCPLRPTCSPSCSPAWPLLLPVPPRLRPFPSRLPLRKHTALLVAPRRPRLPFSSPSRRPPLLPCPSSAVPRASPITLPGRSPPALPTLLVCWARLSPPFPPMRVATPHPTSRCAPGSRGCVLASASSPPSSLLTLLPLPDCPLPPFLPPRCFTPTVGTLARPPVSVMPLCSALLRRMPAPQVWPTSTSGSRLPWRRTLPDSDAPLSLRF